MTCFPQFFFACCLMQGDWRLGIPCEATDGIEGIATDDEAVLRPEPPEGSAHKPEGPYC